jgi:hypothetical protein
MADSTLTKTPAATTVEVQSAQPSSGGSVLPYLAIAGAGYLLLSGSGDGVKRAVDGVGNAIGAAGDLVADAARMIGYTLTWPELVYKMIAYPDAERAKMLFGTMYPTLFEACREGALSEAGLYLGYDPKLAVLRPPRLPFDSGFEFGRYREDMAHVIPRSPKQIEIVGDGYMGKPDWADMSFVAVHNADPVIVRDGHMYAIDPTLQYILDIVRYGQSMFAGFNVWPDGSNGHPREGWVEGWLMAALLRSFYPSVPIGHTQGVLLSQSVRYFCAVPTRPGAPPICPSGVSYDYFPTSDGWLLKGYFAPSSVGFTHDASHMPMRCEPGIGGDASCCIGYTIQGTPPVMMVPGDCGIPGSRSIFFSIAPMVRTRCPPTLATCATSISASSSTPGTTSWRDRAST